MAKNRMVQLIDMGVNTRPLGHAELTTEDEERCYVRLPFDFPAYIRMMRLIDKEQKGKSISMDQTGWTVEFDLFTYGVKVFLRIGKDGTFKVITEDSDGRETVASYQLEEEG